MGHEQADPTAPGEGLFGGRPYRTGWIFVGTLTAVYLLWLWIRLTLQPAWLDALPDLVNEMVNLIELGWGLTLAILWIVLVWRYRQRTNAARSDVPDLEELVSMDPGAFERYVAGLFHQKGYGVVQRGRSGDHGVDLELTSPTGKQAIVQCKRYQGTVGEDVVRDLFGTLMHERVARAFLVTTGEISGAAKLWANGKPLTLIDGNTLLGIASSLADSDSG
jgi:restriction system protein